LEPPLATTLAVLTPYSAEFPSSNFPALMTVNARPVLAFDASTAETCYWTLIAPQGLASALTLVVTYMMASATSGKVDFAVAVEAVSDGDATDLDAGTSFGSDNTITAPTVPGTAGYIDQFTCTLTNDDSIAVGDYVRISLRRDAADGTNDTATGDCYILAVELQKA
jgi:hypothetical protein